MQTGTGPANFLVQELWSSMDCNISVIIASMLALRPYLRLMREHRQSRHRIAIPSPRMTSLQGPSIVAGANLDRVVFELGTNCSDWEREAPVVQANTSGPKEGDDGQDFEPLY